MAITRKALAEALGISPASVTKHGARGMPCHSVEAAQRWRDRHLDPSRTKAYRADYRMTVGARGVEVSTASTPAAMSRTAAFEHALRLAGVASKLIDRGCFDDVESDLRAALRAIPRDARDDLLIDVRVLDALCADVLRVARELEAELAGEHGAEGAEWAPGEAEDFWWSVIIGDVRCVDSVASGAPGA